MREFIYIAIDGAVSHLYESGLRRHIEDALRAGATKEEVLQVIMLATAAEGQLPNAKGHAILLEEMGAPAPALTCRAAAAQAGPRSRRPAPGRRPATRCWRRRRNSPRAFSATARWPGPPGRCPGKVKAFIGLAVCASPSLLYEPGMRRHIRLALDHGAHEGRDQRGAGACQCDRGAHLHLCGARAGGGGKALELQPSP